MSYEAQNAIDQIGAAGGGDEQFAVGLGISGALADAASYTFTVTSQVDFQPERLELYCAEASLGAITVDTFTIAGENQLGSADPISATIFQPRAPLYDVRYDEWTAGSTLTIVVTNHSGSSVQVTGTLFGEKLAD